MLVVLYDSLKIYVVYIQYLISGEDRLYDGSKINGRIEKYLSCKLINVLAQGWI
jgi:hypothetical protein